MMNKKGTQASQGTVIWAVAAAAVVLLFGGIFAYSNIKGDINSQGQALSDNVNAKVDALNTKVDTATGQLNTAVSELRDTAASLETSATDPDLCNNIDGCGGQWDVPWWFRQAYANRVLTELTEDDYRDLANFIDDQISLDDNDDIEDAWITEIGDVKTNQNPNRGFTESRKTTVTMVIAVTYYPDGDDSDTKTKYFLVKAIVDEQEDGIGDSDVDVLSVERVSADYIP